MMKNRKGTRNFNLLIACIISLSVIFVALPVTTYAQSDTVNGMPREIYEHFQRTQAEDEEYAKHLIENGMLVPPDPSQNNNQSPSQFDPFQSIAPRNAPGIGGAMLRLSASGPHTVTVHCTAVGVGSFAPTNVYGRMVIANRSGGFMMHDFFFPSPGVNLPLTYWFPDWTEASILWAYVQYANGQTNMMSRIPARSIMRL